MAISLNILRTGNPSVGAIEIRQIRSTIDTPTRACLSPNRNYAKNISNGSLLNGRYPAACAINRSGTANAGRAILLSACSPIFSKPKSSRPVVPSRTRAQCRCRRARRGFETTTAACLTPKHFPQMPLRYIIGRPATKLSSIAFERTIAMTASEKRQQTHLMTRLARSGPRKLLALDGGGIRGVLSLEILAEMERLLIEQSGNPDYRLADYFDYVSGTSTGGIIAAGIATGMSVAEVMEVDKTNGGRMFH